MEHTHLVKGLDYALLQKVSLLGKGNRYSYYSQSILGLINKFNIFGMYVCMQVRCEIDTKVDEEGEEEIEEDEKLEQKKPSTDVVPPPPKKAVPNTSEPDTVFKTKLAKNIYRTLFQTSIPERNELFAPGRMAFVFDLEEEYAESDIPTTVIRSKADVPLSEVWVVFI